MGLSFVVTTYFPFYRQGRKQVSLSLEHHTIIIMIIIVIIEGKRVYLGRQVHSILFSCHFPLFRVFKSVQSVRMQSTKILRNSCYLAMRYLHFLHKLWLIYMLGEKWQQLQVSPSCSFLISHLLFVEGKGCPSKHVGLTTLVSLFSQSVSLHCHRTWPSFLTPSLHILDIRLWDLSESDLSNAWVFLT